MLRFDERVHLPKNRENTITFLVNGEPIGTVETLAPGAKTVDIPIPPVDYDSVTSALGYVPYNSTNPNNYITSSALNGYATETWVGQQGYAKTNQIPTAISDLVDDTATTPIDKAESVVDNNSGSLKFWSGTKAQYDAIVTKDADTLYNITDDANPTLSILEMLYPVGSIYIGTMSACPLQTLGVGTWQLVATDRVLQGAGTRGSVGTTVNESLPNIKGNIEASQGHTGATSGGMGVFRVTNGAFTGTANYQKCPATNTTGWAGSASNLSIGQISLNASNSSSTYQDNAPVQQDAYLVNIWERIS